MALLLVLLAALPAQQAAAQTPPLNLHDLEAELTAREAQLVAAVNVERANAGLLPLRWNRNLSEAARWFARDAVLTRPFCGHEDSLGRGPGARLRAFGYTNISLWGEAVTCGFTEPTAAVDAWMEGDDQRTTLMDPDAREAGAGYFYSDELQRGYIVFVAAADPAFAPVVINNEAISTNSPQVTLTLAPQSPAAAAMKVTNTTDFDAVAWEPYAAHKAWTLSEGQGWRTVYVLLRGSDNQTQLLSDTIYLGSAAPQAEIALSQATSIGSAFSAELPPALAGASVRLSLGWSLDSSSLAPLANQAQPVTENDTNAVDGSALRLPGSVGASSAGPSSVGGVLTTLPVNKLLTAYFRLKVSAADGDAEVARLSVRAGGRQFGPLVLKASDFAQAETYQEFPLDFAFPNPPLSTNVEVQVERTGDADVVVDTVRFYGQPVATDGPIVWTTGSSDFRGQGVIARTEDGSGLGAPFYMMGTAVDAAAAMPQQALLAATPNALVFNSYDEVMTPANSAVVLCSAACADVAWRATAQAPWLKVDSSFEGIIVSADPVGLAKGIYNSFITVTPAQGVNAASLTISVELRVDGAEPLQLPQIRENVYLPLANRP